MQYEEKQVEMTNNLLKNDLGIWENLSCPFRVELTTFHHLLSPAGQIKLHVNYVKNIFQPGKTKLYWLYLNWGVFGPEQVPRQSSISSADTEEPAGPG